MRDFPVTGGGLYPLPFTNDATVAQRVSGAAWVLLGEVDLVHPVRMNVEVVPFALPQNSSSQYNVPDALEAKLVIGKNRDVFPDQIYRIPATGLSINTSARKCSVWARVNDRFDIAGTFFYTLTSGISPGHIRRDAQSDNWVRAGEVEQFTLPIPAFARSYQLESEDGTAQYTWENASGGSPNMRPTFLQPPLLGEFPIPPGATQIRVNSTATDTVGTVRWGFQ